MTRERLLLIAKTLGVFLCLYLFIVGIGGMGYSFKLFGKDFAEKVLTMTASPFVGLFIGILGTALVQSSSTSTSIIVGMVAGGAIAIDSAIFMVMGANIGTTVTNLMVSLGHITRTTEFRRAFGAAIIHDLFNWMVVLILFPLELATGILARLASGMAGWFEGAGGLKLADPLQAATRPAIQLISQLVADHPVFLLIVSVLLTFGMLASIVKLLRSLVLKKVETFFDEYLFKNAARAMLFGMLLTIAVQSSSITTSVVIPLAGAGILRLSQIFPYTLGANVGTTVTAMLAALSTGSPAAVTVSFGHLLFNLAGILIIWPVRRVRAIPVRLAEKLAELSMRNRLIPFGFILLVFFVIPGVLILLFK
jgi:solute carrier family 34 (sodium-dependent phosphate cotransporter)